MTSVSPSRAEGVARASSSLAELAEVVDLAVENDPDGLVFVRKRLLAGLHVDDGEAAEGEAAAALCVAVGAGVVRAAVDKLGGHDVERGGINATLRVDAQDTGDPTHDRIIMKIGELGSITT
jgi:hypothetical protein